MNVAQFRSDPGLVKQWDEMLAEHALLRLVLLVLEAGHPARYALNGDVNGDISPTRAGIELGMTRGYSKALDTMRLLAVPLPKPEPVETTYEKPDETQKPAA